MADITNNGVANQVAFGQYGSTYSNSAGGTDNVQPPAGLVIIAITFLEDLSLDTLTSADSGEETFNHGSAGLGGDGEAIADGTVFPKGLTIYGRWKDVKLETAGTASGIIVYFGP
tara:strand:+ start:126 stop:470 length:345 start_codon:yes stop_codon:yes gene_type:complete